MYYSTRIHPVACHKGATGYQPELVRRDGKGLNCIEGNVWASKAEAQAQAADLLAAAADLFAAHDETAKG